MNMKNFQVAIIGLGYIGLPLAINLSKFFKTTGYDLNQKRISELRKGIDRTEEISKNEIRSKNNLVFTSNLEDIKNSNFYIIAVQSPIKKDKSPDFGPLIKACKDISKIIKKNDICVFESTVYPGATEEVLIPIIEKNTKYKFNSDFFIGYSPERINPGDKKRQLKNITKVISGSNKKTTKIIHSVYSKIIHAGLHVASSIKIAEASKVIENVQRDLNIALINELSMIFDKMKINTGEVLNASSTKWNFIRYEPGLVGGHCIGVDPYYLTYKSKKLGLFPNVILSGRKINDKMHEFIGNKFIKNFSTKKKKKILILGYTFKENCPDIRNTKVYDLVNYLKSKDLIIHIADPWVQKDELNPEIKKIFYKNPKKNNYDGIIISVKHKCFSKFGIKKIKKLGKKKATILDLKNLFPNEKNFLRI